MARTHKRKFRVRYYECDARGIVTSANFLRYMQEAAFDASAAAGYDNTRYEELGTIWLIRNTEIDLRQPVRYGDAVEIKTWVADFRHVRSKRAYELMDMASGDVVAYAHTDWVYLDRASGRPARIGPELMSAFQVERRTRPEPARRRLFAAASLPAGVFRVRRRVEGRDLDQVQHVNNAIYLDFVDDCSLRAMDAIGWSQERILAQEAQPFARRHQIDYRQPARLNDELEISMWASSMDSKRFVLHCVIARVDDLLVLAQTRSVIAWRDQDTGSPERIPDAFRRDLAPTITDTAGGENLRNGIDPA